MNFVVRSVPSLSRGRGASGHLSEAERTRIMDMWQGLECERGIVARIARELGHNKVTVSNLVLKETGKRPSFHIAAAKHEKWVSQLINS